MRSGTLSKWALTTLCFCALVTTAEAAQVVYVDDNAPAGGSGSSWAGACKHLQDALAIAAAAEKPVEIRVAQGVYKPDQGAGITPGDQMVTFQLLNGVTIKGGYAGATAPDPNACDISLYETILSGDLAGDNDDGQQNTRDDSCCVVEGRQVDGTAVMDGLTLVGRLRTVRHCAISPLDDTACMILDGGSPTIRDCHFATDDGLRRELMIRLYASAPTFIGCVFSGNDTAVAAKAGKPTFLDCLFTGNGEAGVACYAESTASFTDCRFESNEAGIHNSGNSNLTLTDCTFVDNATAMDGESGTLTAAHCLCHGNNKGIYRSFDSVTATDCRFEGGTYSAVDNTGDTILIRCSFTGNSGLFPVYSVGTLTAADCIFIANAGQLEGAIQGIGAVTLRNCEFIGNSGEEQVSTVSAHGDIFRATGCLFAGNSGRKSAVIVNSTTVCSVSNCTFADNRGTPSAIRCYRHGPAYPAAITQCILRGGPVMLDEPPSDDPAVVTYSNVQGGYTGEGNVDVDPCFVAPGHWADPNDSSIVLGPESSNAVWVPGDYHLKSQAGHWDRAAQTWTYDEVTSACIDAGDPNAAVDAEPFPNGGFVNMGAYGGTAEASRTYFGGPVCETQIAGDINGDCIVDDTDMEILTSHWLQEGWPVTDLAPAITITQPQDGDEFDAAMPVSIRADATDPDGTVIRVGFVIALDSESYYDIYNVTDIDPSDGWGYEWQWAARGRTPEELETWTIRAEVLDDGGNIAVSPEIKIKLRVNQ